MPKLKSLDTRLSCSWVVAMLAAISELNTEILEAMFGATARAGIAGDASSLQWRWRGLGEPARLRLAHCPYLLLDAGFAAAQTWAGLGRAGVHEEMPASAAPGTSAPLAAALIRRVLHFAWHLAPCNSPGARVALGMSLDCVTAVARCPRAHLGGLAEHPPARIPPRWAHLPGVLPAPLAPAGPAPPRPRDTL